MDKQMTGAISTMERRKFLATLPFLAAAPLLVFSQSEEEKKKPLTAIMKADEWEQVKQSPMAMELEEYFGHGYSCAESLWLTALRRMKKPEELVWTAGAFGGGMGQKDICGFLSAGLMAIGTAAGQLKMPRPEARKVCSREAKAYWQWFQPLSPIHCAEIRPPGSSGDICRRLGHICATKVNQVIDAMAGA
ncbi:MAG: C-GCAxxG-C-C family protein [Candidatus Aminicenantes bacterium]|nr:C-GCAxxG-C-C family protein [Candidatus Aminicenantes bacterium]